MFIKRVNASSMKPHALSGGRGVDIDGHIPWRERMELDEAEALGDDESLDDLLESIEDGGAAGDE